MTLFLAWQGYLILPPLPERREKIAGNMICQRPFRGSRCRAEIAPSQYKGHDLIKTDLAAPFDQILLRQKGARRVDSPFPVLTTRQLSDVSDLTESTDLFWDSAGKLEHYAETPEQVLALWRNKFRFRVESEDGHEPGLRMPQSSA